MACIKMTLDTRYSFSERKRLQSSGLPAFSYTVSARTRKQLATIILNCFRREHGYNGDYDVQQRLNAVMQVLSEKHAVDLQDYFDFEHYLLEGGQSDDEFLDCVEYTVFHLALLGMDQLRTGNKSWLDAWSELKERLNTAMSMAGVGYVIGYGPALVRVDSDAIHSLVIEPAMQLVRDRRFASANDDFCKALGYLKTGDTKEACTYARRALESALKVIAHLKNWTKQGKPLTGNETLTPLLQLAFENKLIPDEVQASLNGLRPFLEATVPKVTNPPSHGSTHLRVVPAAIAEFAVSSVASQIVLMVKLAALGPSSS